MAMINCPECGKEISDLAQSCPNCGFPMAFSSASNSAITHEKINYTAPIVVEEQSKKPAFGIWVTIGCILTLFFIISVSTITSSMSSDKNNVEEKVADSPETVAETVEEKPEYIVAHNQNYIESDIEETQITEEEWSEENQDITYEDVFFYDLMDNIESYNGKYVRTVIQVSDCRDSETEHYITSQYPDYDLVSNYDNIIVYPDNYSDFKYGEYITVEGRIGKNGSKDVLANAHIVNYGEEAKAAFDAEKSILDENILAQEQEYEADFKENATSPTYDDLLRYPDSYKEIQIKVNAKIVKVEPDGIILDGNIEATMAGETIALYDGRDVKEPKLRDGDSVTIYGYGYGTTTVKVQDVSGWLPKTVDKYSIPAIKIKYIEFN